MAHSSSEPPSLYVDMEVDQLADFMFLRNANNAIIELSLGGVEDNKDLFCFLTDLFCKGLVMRFGVNGRRVELDDLTLENFKEIKDKMGLAGIDVQLLMSSNDCNLKPGINLKEIDDMPPSTPLEEFRFTVISSTHIYSIYFTLKHTT